MGTLIWWIWDHKDADNERMSSNAAPVGGESKQYKKEKRFQTHEVLN